SRALPGQAERGVDVGLHPRQDVPDSGLAAGGDGPRPRTSDDDGTGAHRDHLHHVQARADPTVGEYLDLIAHRVHYLGQGAGGRWHRVELAAAVVRHDHAVDADLGGLAGVVGVQHALDHEPAAPVLPHPGYVLPGDARVEL